MQSVVCVEETRVGIWVELLVGGVLKEAAVRIEAGLEQFPDELSEQAAAVDASLVRAREVNELHLHAQAQVRLCGT